MKHTGLTSYFYNCRSSYLVHITNETLSDGLVIAILSKSLPDSYKPFAVHVTQSTSEITFATL